MLIRMKFCHLRGHCREVKVISLWNVAFARGAVVRVSKTRKEISRPVNKLYPIESIDNKKKEMNDASETIVTRNCP